MIVPKRKLNKWKAALEHGDFQLIEDVGGPKRQVVSRAFLKGAMADKTYLALQMYFEMKRLYKPKK